MKKYSLICKTINHSRGVGAADITTEYSFHTRKQAFAFWDRLDSINKSADVCGKRDIVGTLVCHESTVSKTVRVMHSDY